MLDRVIRSIPADGGGEPEGFLEEAQSASAVSVAELLLWFLVCRESIYLPLLQPSG
jgi:hypothetical protein